MTKDEYLRRLLVRSARPLQARPKRIILLNTDQDICDVSWLFTMSEPLTHTKEASPSEIVSIFGALFFEERALMDLASLVVELTEALPAVYLEHIRESVAQDLLYRFGQNLYERMRRLGMYREGVLYYENTGWLAQNALMVHLEDLWNA